jgi:hypothetical protein
MQGVAAVDSRGVHGPCTGRAGLDHDALGGHGGDRPPRPTQSAPLRRRRPARNINNNNMTPSGSRQSNTRRYGATIAESKELVARPGQ